MKVTITAEEAMEKGIWIDIMNMFGLDSDQEIYPREEFILTEAQARKLGLLASRNED